MTSSVPQRSGVRAEGLYGRHRERRVLDRLVADVLAGSSQVLVLRGEPGIGKSALLEHFVERVAGWRRVDVEGVESEVELPYSSLQKLCEPLLVHLGALPGPQQDALATVFERASGPAPDRFLVALATLSLLAEAAEDGPLACIVDDAQWLDPASAQVLATAARRLHAERVALVCAARTGTGGAVLAGAPDLAIGGLSNFEARALLLANIHSPLDTEVVARLLAECRGNPLALLALPRAWTPAELAGGFGLPHDGLVAGQVELSYAHRILSLAPDTRLLVLTAAAEPLGDPVLLRRAATTLGVDTSALGPAVDEGLVKVQGRVTFAHPLVRSAAYTSADAEDRRRVHRALAAATDEKSAPDRRAWHRAAGTVGPDEQVAAELQRSADRAQARGGVAAAAAFLTRATELTSDPAVRTRRALDAAFAKLRAGALDSARDLLAVVTAGPLDDHQQAELDLLRAEMALVARRSNDAAPLLLAAARRLRPLDPELARATLLDAFSSAHFAARLNDGVDMADLAEAARDALASGGAEPTAGDRLLETFAALTHDYAGAVTLGRGALAELRSDEVPRGRRMRLLWQGSVLALELWDDEGAYALSDQQLRIVRTTGALSELPLALSSFVPILVFCGELATAEELMHEARSVEEAAGVTATAYGALAYGAWRGQVRTTRALIDVKRREARSRREGIGLAVCGYAQAVLYNGLGDYDRAVVAAMEACADPHELVVHNWGLVELVESAMRTGRADLAREAQQRLTTKARASGTPWALGVEARARALVSRADTAEDAYRESVHHLAQSRVRAELARTHLLYGEWLRRADRRLDARTALGVAHEAFTTMGIEGFAQRSRHELLATGTSVATRPRERHDALTAQEAHIARLARDGLSNPDIGARLFISARTVEWHLRKVYSKLGVSSRRELHRALPEPEGPTTAT